MCGDETSTQCSPVSHTPLPGHRWDSPEGGSPKGTPSHPPYKKEKNLCVCGGGGREMYGRLQYMNVLELMSSGPF